VLIAARQASKSARRADASASVSSAMRTRRDSADATSAAAKSLIISSLRFAPR
jgi:hypothetical protein